jgi:hypothetical protein
MAFTGFLVNPYSRVYIVTFDALGGTTPYKQHVFEGEFATSQDALGHYFSQNHKPKCQINLFSLS